MVKKCNYCKKNYTFNCCFKSERYNINYYEDKKRKKFYKSPRKIQKIKKNLTIICEQCLFCNKIKTLDCCMARQWLLSARAEEAAICHRIKTRGISIIRTPKEEE